jgi:hypothetical protein
LREGNYSNFVFELRIKNLSEKWIARDLKPQMHTDKHREKVLAKGIFG